MKEAVTAFAATMYGGSWDSGTAAKVPELYYIRL